MPDAMALALVFLIILLLAIAFYQASQTEEREKDIREMDKFLNEILDRKEDDDVPNS